jgi:hypothetical protein
MATNIPKILLHNEEGKHEGEIGSYCWNGICVDKGLPKNKPPKEKIRKRRDSEVSFDVEGHSTPSNFSVTIFSEDNKIVLTRTIEKKLKLNLPAGDYLVNVMARWLAGEDVSYSFFVEII